MSNSQLLVLFNYHLERGSGFPKLAPYLIDSDAGWGCMLRCAQVGNSINSTFVLQKLGKRDGW